MLPNVKKSVSKFVKSIDLKSVLFLMGAAFVLNQMGFCTSGLTTLVTSIEKLFKWVGAVLMLVGVAKFAMALKDENGPGQSQAILFAVSGGILIGLNTVIKVSNFIK